MKRDLWGRSTYTWDEWLNVFVAPLRLVAHVKVLFAFGQVHLAGGRWFLRRVFVGEEDLAFAALYGMLSFLRAASATLS